MKASTFLALVSLLSGTAASAVAVPEGPDAHVRYSQSPAVFGRDAVSPKDLWKRKGGGRVGGGTGGGGSGRTGGGGGTTANPRTSSTSNTGGRTVSGSGPAPPYRGATYAGGSKVPQPAGRPIGRIAPFLLVGGLVAFWPGVWLAGAYMYPYHNNWHYHNRTSNKNESAPVICGCAPQVSCGCEDNNNQTFINDTIGSGSAADMRQREVAVADVNGTRTILINGTLPNGTTAAGGDDDDDGSAAAARLLQSLGYWPVVVTVMAAVLTI